MEVEDDKIVTPGIRVGRNQESAVGENCYLERNFIYASATGEPATREAEQLSDAEDEQNEDSGKPIAYVKKAAAAATIPRRGQSVIARVQKINQGDRVDCEILMVEGDLLQSPFKGVIRLHDIREFDVDNLEILNCFRPGDVIKAHVLSLGDSRSVYLSTYGEQFGVIMATSLEGGSLTAVSFEMMVCQKTGKKEFRKVAKPTNIKQDNDEDM